MTIYLRTLHVFAMHGDVPSCGGRSAASSASRIRTGAAIAMINHGHAAHAPPETYVTYETCVSVHAFMREDEYWCMDTHMYACIDSK